MTEFSRKLALIAAAVVVPTGLALGALAIGSDTGAPPVRVEDSAVTMHTPNGPEGRTSSSSSSSTASSTPTPAPVPEPAPAPVQPVQPVQPVVPYYDDDGDDDWDDWDGDDGDDWDDD